MWSHGRAFLAKWHYSSNRLQGHHQTNPYGDCQRRHQQPHKINPQEAHLPRKTGATLSQLRSGHCIRLKDYMHRIGKADDNYCPSCHIASDSTAHLFNCTSHPTSLTPDDLWRRPFEAASFLVSLPAFNDLPAVGPLPPPRRRRGARPPPEPPPSPRPP